MCDFRGFIYLLSLEETGIIIIFLLNKYFVPKFSNKTIPIRHALITIFKRSRIHVILTKIYIFPTITFPTKGLFNLISGIEFLMIEILVNN